MGKSVVLALWIKGELQMLKEKTQNNDFLIFADDVAEESIQENSKWKIMIVDDEPEVHNLTKLVLKDFIFDDKKIEFISAYSGQEAIKCLESIDEIALVLLDVVMEDDDTGLKIVKYIRNILHNNLIRIILRTGQPGYAPEEKVIMDYDINDYKEKTELTIQKLYTAIISSLRSYRDLKTIESNKKGLEKIIESSATIFEIQSMREFTSGILYQLIAILGLNKNSLYCQTSSFAATKDNGSYIILAGTGDYYAKINNKIDDALNVRVLTKLEEAYTRKSNVFYRDCFVVYFQSKYNTESVVYFEGLKKLDKWDIDLIKIFSSNVSIAFDNIYLSKEVEDTQKEIIFTLGEIAEARSNEVGNHVKRVAEYCKILALGYGLSEEEAELIRVASPMHDIGKIAIPDSILNKPDKLTVEEFEIIKTHTSKGFDMLKNSNRKIMKTAEIIALQHHERYDGTGYPFGLKGEEISLFGRISAIADVFDALCHERVYKKAWPIEDVVKYIRDQKGKHFDPVFVDIFFENLDKMLEIKEKLPSTKK